MIDTANETEALITSIRTRSEAEEDASQAIHLIRLIPYAGGAIASIISEMLAGAALKRYATFFLT